jgi:hypothetical protein
LIIKETTYAEKLEVWAHGIYISKSSSVYLDKDFTSNKQCQWIKRSIFWNIQELSNLSCLFKVRKKGNFKLNLMIRNVFSNLIECNQYKNIKLDG